MNLLEYMNMVTSTDAITKEQLSDIMRNGSYKEKEEIWKRINELGGYESLED